MGASLSTPPSYCGFCGKSLGPEELRCDQCDRLTRGPELERLENLARERLDAGQVTAARDAYVEMLRLLPEGPERDTILARAQQLSRELAVDQRRVARSAGGQNGAGWARKLGPLGALGALLVKFKSLAFLLLTKGKLLISAFAFVGLYWAFYGWRFALGFFVSLFVHEMGHYVVVRRYGFAAELPVFIPGFGAFVRWQGANVDPVIRARISLAGPLAGLLAALACFTAFQTTGSGIWLALAQIGAYINLFNLIPVSLFDGGTAMGALGRQERWAALIVNLLLLFLLDFNICFVFLALGTGYRIYKRDYPSQSSHSTGLLYVGLIVVLGLLSWYSVQLFRAQVYHPHWNQALDTLGRLR